MKIEDEKKLTLSRRIASVWVVIAMGVAIVIGIVGNAMSKSGVIPTLDDGETIIIAIATVLSKHGVVCALIAGIILAGILAATMSTADSQLLAASSSESQNIFKEVFFKNMSEKASMITARVTVIIISLIAVFIARDSNSSVFRIVSFAWAGFGAAFGPVVLFALFWKRMNKQGALAGMLGGGIMVFVWKYIVRPLGGAFDIYELLPAFIVSSILIVIVSLLTKEYNIPTVVSMNPIMIDGTGMCGGCRLTVGGEVKFACVDGPEFDGHLVDFDEAIARSSMYRSTERHAHEETCNLYAKEVE